MEKTFSVVYLIIFLGLIIVNLKILLESNFHKLFKQGKITHIRIFYIMFSIILSFLFTSAVIRFMEEINNLM